VSTVGTRRSRRSWTQLTWSQNQRAQAERDGDERDGDAPLNKGLGYEVFSYVIAGMLAYGFIGWLVGRAVHIEMLFPIGAVVGLALSLGWVVYRYGFKGGGQ
jgi:ATP synthase protein I